MIVKRRVKLIAESCCWLMHVVACVIGGEGSILPAIRLMNVMI